MRKRIGIITPTISPFKKGSVDEDAGKEKRKAESLQLSIGKDMKILSKVEFPLAYHYMFYRKLMQQSAINALHPFYRNDAAYIRDIAKKLAPLL